MKTWEPAYFCTECDEELSHNDRLFSYGVCPFCGNQNESGTIVENYQKSRRWVVDFKQPWWKFWKLNEGHWEYNE